MKCPECSGPTVVKDSRERSEYIYRRRQCECGVRFSTKEIAFNIQLPPENEIARLEELNKLIASQIHDANQSLKGRMVRRGSRASAQAVKSLDKPDKYGRTLYDRL